jgi:hypothetical protein
VENGNSVVTSFMQAISFDKLCGKRLCRQTQGTNPDPLEGAEKSRLHLIPVVFDCGK